MIPQPGLCASTPTSTGFPRRGPPRPSTRYGPGEVLARLDHRCCEIHGAAGNVGAIIEKLDKLEQHPEAPDVGTDSFDDADDDAYDPTEFINEGDEF
jgi:hypothetical protein